MPARRRAPTAGCDTWSAFCRQANLLFVVVPAKAGTHTLRHREAESVDRLLHRIGGNDLLVAAPGRALGAVIVTANTQEIRRVRDVKVENWLA
jgi:predicted nucleic acid-binding protein